MPRGHRTVQYQNKKVTVSAIPVCFSSSVGKVTDLDTGIYSSHSRMPVLRFESWSTQAADSYWIMDTSICGPVGPVHCGRRTGSTAPWVLGAVVQARFMDTCHVGVTGPTEPLRARHLFSAALLFFFGQIPRIRTLARTRARKAQKIPPNHRKSLSRAQAYARTYARAKSSKN